MSHQLCKDVGPYCPCRGPSRALTPQSPGPSALCVPTWNQNVYTNTPFSDALGEQRRSTRHLRHDKHARKPRRRGSEPQLRFVRPVEKMKCNKTRLQRKQGSEGPNF